MTISSRLLTVVLPVLLLGACASLSDQDKASLASANQKADQAMSMAQQAMSTAQQALEVAKSAQASAAQAAANAQAANEKADRIFQRSLRK